MRYIAGIDIGNSSTEVALATLNEAGALTITHSALAETTGIKGTLRNVFGIQEALALVAKRAGISVSDISLIRINEATPVIGDVAMETITETIITESTMIGHNPKTPGGAGLGVGITITPQELLTRPADAPYILVVSSAFDFADIASVPEMQEFYLSILNSSGSDFDQPVPNGSGWQSEESSVTLPNGKPTGVSLKKEHGIIVVRV